ncbi:hypothetical protein CROQUDRAFT_99406 [Cronartium quercuum f. sp. fusiforme G11]|uniref:Transposase n=1 Tax=Cronartium quercuum f. sp. fusiforme G11 TaxID=708437 RepID=A0A9P6NBU4_9BASI|nr:hypothetical protein CROQUDRAFT_99406 [Cronartium quercuum f. sp. fusiforme G11]
MAPGHRFTLTSSSTSFHLPFDSSALTSLTTALPSIHVDDTFTMVKYSPDIKNLAVKMFIEGNNPQQINLTLRTNISFHTLMRWKALYRTTQSASASIYLDELQDKFFDLTGIRVSLSTLSRVLHQRLGLSLLISRALDRRQFPVARAAYIAAIHRIPADYLVFIGEKDS